MFSVAISPKKITTRELTKQNTNESLHYTNQGLEDRIP
jgi:hypothetical protein